MKRGWDLSKAKCRPPGAGGQRAPSARKWEFRPVTLPLDSPPQRFCASDYVILHCTGFSHQPTWPCEAPWIADPRHHAPRLSPPEQCSRHPGRRACRECDGGGGREATSTERARESSSSRRRVLAAARCGRLGGTSRRMRPSRRAGEAALYLRFQIACSNCGRISVGAQCRLWAASSPLPHASLAGHIIRSSSLAAPRAPVWVRFRSGLFQRPRRVISVLLGQMTRAVFPLVITPTIVALAVQDA